MFRGRFEHTLDGKGRLALPAPFRRALQEAQADTLVVTTHIASPCLVATPVSEWERFEERLAQLPQFDPGVMLMRRLYVGSAHDCPVDRQGRLLIPPPLRAHANLERDVVWVGGMKTIEIWSKDRWQQDVESKRADVTPDMLDKLGALGI